MDCWATKAINKPKRRSCTVCICFIARHQPVSHQSVKPNSARGEPHAATCTCVKVLNITEWQKVSDKLLRLLHLCHILLPSYFTCYTVYFFWSRLFLSLSHPASRLLDCCSSPLSLHACVKAGSRCFVTRRSESLREMEPLWARLCRRRRRESLHFHFQPAFSLLQERALIPPPDQHHRQYNTTACLIDIMCS